MARAGAEAACGAQAQPSTERVSTRRSAPLSVHGIGLLWPLWVTGSASWPRRPMPSRSGEGRGSALRGDLARSAARLGGSAWLCQAASAARSATSREGRSGASLVGGCWGAKGPAAGVGVSRPPGGQAQARRRQR